MRRSPQGLGTDLRRLTALQRELRATLDRIDRTLAAVTVGRMAEGGSARGMSPVRPLRMQVLDLLQELGLMAYTREIQAYAYARLDLVVRPGRFGTLASDERAAYDRRGAARTRNRTLWLCHALRHDDAAPVRRVLGRSDWALERRMWAPTTGRVQHLKMLSRLCELALDDAVHFANPDALNVFVQGYAQVLPVKMIPDSFPFTEWREHADELLRELETEDYELRIEAAERWSELAESHRLFGVEASERDRGDVAR